MGVLDGRVAVVTGGSRGIGKAIMRRLAADGAAVVFSYNENERLAEEAVAEVTTPGARVHAARADLSRVADISALFDETERLFGAVDVLVNNAGEGAAESIVDVSEDFYDRMMAVNTKGTFFAIQQAVRRLRDGGSIISVSSASTVAPQPGDAVYGASKAAVDQFTRIAARELGSRQITVNAVSPGPVDTDLLRNGNPIEVLEMAAGMTPLGRLGRPDDIAGVVAFLSGPDSRWVTGHILYATGGLA